MSEEAGVRDPRPGAHDRLAARRTGGSGWRWVLALALTLVSAAWQRVSGPTYPVSGEVRLGDRTIHLRLERSHGGAGDQPVVVEAPDCGVTGEMAWRRFPARGPWTLVPMRRDGATLVAVLPHQPEAGKLEYRVTLRLGGGTALFPARPAVTRFKGEVPAAILLPHIVAMFAAMLFSNRAGLSALAGGPGQRGLAVTALLLLVVGGFVFGPAVQKAAFGSWWTGVPYGWDLTDNKTLLAGVAWLLAVWRLRGGRRARAAVLAAALATLAVFAIPHSVWGSELR